MASCTHNHIKPSSINTTLLNNILFRNSDMSNSKNQESIGILAFEIARIMSRLVSIYKSISDEEMKRMKNDVVKSKGVLYLNSHNEDYLLNLACSEKSEDLNKVAITVSRLSKRCSEPDMQKFDELYKDLKVGILDMGKLEYGTKRMEKVVQKMERDVQETANLYTAIEGLNEMELSEKKLQIWKKKKRQDQAKLSQANFELFEDKIAYQRKQVRHYKRTSLWSKSFDRCVELMAQTVFVVYARLGIVFAPYIIGQPQSSTKTMLQRQQEVHQEHDFCLLSDRDKYVKRRQIPPKKDYCLLSERYKHARKPNSKTLSRAKQISKSGPIPQTSRKIETPLFYSSELSPIDIGFDNNRDNNSIKGVTNLASSSTVGGAGLAYRYANVIIMAESCLYSVTSISDEARSELYDMLPETMKLKVKAKLMKKKDKMMENIEAKDHGHMQLAEGWREALEEIMGWLAPIAHDTMQWQNERKLERQRFDAKSGVLLLQTLHFADLEKTEAAIVDVLVGLSCMYMYERRSNSDDGHHGCEDRYHRPR